MGSDSESRREFIRQSIRRLARIGVEATGQISAAGASSPQTSPTDPSAGCFSEEPPPPAEDSPSPAATAPPPSRRPPDPVWLNQHDAMAYELLGRTNHMISRMAMGCARLTPETAGVAEYALNYGINFFLTAANWGSSEEALATILPRTRDRARIATMSAPADRALAGVPDGELDRAAERFITESIDASLARLKTDQLDFFLIQSVGRPDFFSLPGVAAALARARETGRIAHAGFSTIRNVRAVVAGALESDLFDLMLLPLNPLNRSGMEPLLDRARLRQVGVLGMMTSIAIPPEAVDHNFDFAELPNEIDAWQMTYLYMMRHCPAAGFLSDIATHERVMGNLAMAGWRPTAFQSNELDAIVYDELWPVCRACGGQRNLSDAALEAAYRARARMYESPGPRDPHEDYGPLTICENCEPGL